MVSKLDSRSSGPGSSSDRGNVLSSWERLTLLSKCPSSPSCKNGYRRISAGVTLRWTSIPSRESRNTPSRFMLRKLG